MVTKLSQPSILVMWERSVYYLQSISPALVQFSSNTSECWPWQERTEISYVNMAVGHALITQ